MADRWKVHPPRARYRLVLYQGVEQDLHHWAGRASDSKLKGIVKILLSKGWSDQQIKDLLGAT